MDSEYINLRVVLGGDGENPSAGYKVRVLDAETGREIGGVYRVEFEADVSGVAYVVIYAYPMAIDVTAAGYLKPNKEIGVELLGDGERRYVRLPVIVETSRLGQDDGARRYAKVEE